jgi:hypothetical protein
MNLPSNLVASLVLALTLAPCRAGARKLLWTFNVAKLTGEPANSGEQEPVWGLAFSPDQTSLAIGFGQHWTANPRISRGHVIVVSVGKAGAVLQRFDFDGSPFFFSSKNLVWSPSAKLLAIQDVIFNLGGKQVCSWPKTSRFGGFLSSDRMVTFQRLTNSSTRIGVSLPDCSVEESWQVGSTNVAATCAGSELLALNHFSYSPHQPTDLEIISVPGHNTIRRWTWADGALIGGTSFADSCMLVCAGQPPAQADRQRHAACWNVQTGQKTIENPDILIDPPAETFGAVSEEWVASTVYKIRCIAEKFFAALDTGGCFTISKRRITWSVRTGQEVASWRLAEQKMQMPGPDHKLLSAPFALALSSKQQFLAEGGAGLVHVYSVH